VRKGVPQGGRGSLNATPEARKKKKKKWDGRREAVFARRKAKKKNFLRVKGGPALKMGRKKRSHGKRSFTAIAGGGKGKTPHPSAEERKTERKKRSP